MSLVIEPEETLSFQPPYDATQKRKVSIYNNGELPIAFKVKTTSPKQYCVKPNAGRIEAGSMKEVIIELQPIKDISSYPSRDKFLIQSCPIEGDNTTPVGELWPVLERDKKESMTEKKLRCSFELPGGMKNISSSPSGHNAATGSYSAAVSSPTRDTEDARSVERRLKEALSVIEKTQTENHRLRSELATFKGGDMTLRQRRETDQFALSSSQDAWSNQRDDVGAKFSVTFVIVSAILAFLFGLYIY